MKGTKSLDFFEWLFASGIDTTQIPKIAQEKPDQWVGLEYEVNDPEVSPFPLKADFKVKFVSEKGHLLVADALVTEKVSKDNHNKNPANIKIKTNDKGQKVVELKAQIAAHPFHKYPRNAVCYCGSGRKFKKCHGQVLPLYCEQKQEAGLIALRDWFMENMGQMNEEDYNEFCRNYFARQAQPADTPAPQP